MPQLQLQSRQARTRLHAGWRSCTRRSRGRRGAVLAEHTLDLALPRGLVLKGGYTLAVQARDPTTNAGVSGVEIRRAAFQVELLSPSGAEAIGPVLLTYVSDRS